MSVYTKVTAADLNPLLKHYQAGELQALSGIRDGIENTNYFVSTSTGEYVLTLFEHSTETEIHFALLCMAHLESHGLPCARPLKDQQGLFLTRLNSKPASLVTRLVGRSVHEPNVEQCHAVGQTLAQMHLAGNGIRQHHDNPRGSEWRQRIASHVLPHLNTGQADLLNSELVFQQRELAGLPTGLIHGDLFRDNVLFDGPRLTGLIDLYNAGHDLLLYDLAITVNDWCIQIDGKFDAARLTHMIQAYNEIRPISPDEQQNWSILLRRAALRFWLSRLNSFYFPREGHLTQQKDPAVYEQLLRSYRENPPKWPA